MNTTISNFPTSMMTPSPSPDELIIQQRGRRKIPVTFSPDIDAIKQVSTYLCISYILFLIITFQHFTLFLSLGFFLSLFINFLKQDNIIVINYRVSCFIFNPYILSTNITLYYKVFYS